MPLFKRENLGSVSDFLVVSCGVAELKIVRQPGNLDPPPLCFVCLVVWDARCWAVDCRNLTWQPQRRTSAHWLPSLAGGKGSRTGAHPVGRLLTTEMPKLTPKKAAAKAAAVKALPLHYRYIVVVY